LIDYRSYTTHPKLTKSREFPEPVKEDIDTEVAAEKVFDLEDEFDDADPLAMGSGGGRGNPGGRGGGAGGLAEGGGAMGAPTGIGDGGDGMGMAMGMGGRGGGGGGFGPGGVAGPAEDVVQTRKGSDVTDYWRALQGRPTTDFKLVRFFDVHQKSGETYEYRVRVWLADPNNEDPAGVFDQLRGSSGTAAMGNQGDENEEEEYSGEEDSEEEESGDMFDPAGGNGDDEDEGPVYVKIPITSQMKAADVRKRLGRMETEPDKKDETIEYVSLAEPTGEKEEDGSSKYRLVKVPRHLFRDGTSSKTDLYLKYSRCSEWSAPIKVKVEASRSTIAAGELQPGKVVKMKDASGEDMIFKSSEPISEIAASIWSNDLGARVPAKRKVYRGDSLDFFAPSHVLHPITSQVYLYQTENKAITGMAKYMAHVQTRKVLVDAMGGDEIPLPRAEKMRHHLPTEMLVLNEFGKFEVKNEIDDQTAFRILTLKPDDSKYVGRDRNQKKTRTQDGVGGGRGGGFGG
jgi:hypothetical protein